MANYCRAVTKSLRGTYIIKRSGSVVDPECIIPDRIQVNPDPDADPDPTL